MIYGVGANFSSNCFEQDFWIRGYQDLKAILTNPSVVIYGVDAFFV